MERSWISMAVDTGRQTTHPLYRLQCSAIRTISLKNYPTCILIDDASFKLRSLLVIRVQILAQIKLKGGNVDHIYTHTRNLRSPGPHSHRPHVKITLSAGARPLPNNRCPDGQQKSTNYKLIESIFVCDKRMDIALF
jgi:hypothetical protein